MMNLVIIGNLMHIQLMT